MASRVEEVFEQAMDVPLDQRAQFLDRACGNDSEVRRRVEALLVAHDTHSGFLPEAPLHGDLPGQKHDEDVAPENYIEDQVGSIVDRFKLLERIGEGGFGVVWAAQQLEPVDRRVALKNHQAGYGNQASDRSIRGRKAGAGHDGSPEYCQCAGCRNNEIGSSLLRHGTDPRDPHHGAL